MTDKNTPAPKESMMRLRGRWLNKNEDGVINREATLLSLRETKSASASECLDLRGISLSGEDLSGINFSHCDLSGADLAETNLSDAKFTYGYLTETQLTGANIDKVQAVGADFTKADLSECSGANVSFGAAIMVDSTFFGAKLTKCTFSQAILKNADLRTGDFTDSRFCDTELENANFAGATLQHVDFAGSKVKDAVFNGADLREAILRGMEDYSSALWVNTDIRNVDFCGAYLLRRHIMDENYLHEFKNHSSSNAKLFWVWQLTSDCGRSLFRWGVTIFVVVVVFAGLYSNLAIDYGSYKTVLSPLYFSIVTITTLGYGDVLPMSATAQAVCMLQVIMGYMALGGMLSIFANKMARRAE